MHAFRLLFFIWISVAFFQSVNAQHITVKQGIDFAKKLHEVEILSDKGKKELVKKIKEGNFERNMFPDPRDGSIEIREDLSASYLLDFLAAAFYSEFNYRTGSHFENKVEDKIFAEKEPQELTEEDYDKIQVEHMRMLETFEGYLIEKAIEDEEDFPEEAKVLILGPPMGYYAPFRFYTNEHGLIHHRRSALGKTCTRTLQDLYTIGLINKRVFDEAFKAIQDNETAYEMKLLSFVYERARYYEDFELNKAKELEFIDGLREAEVISEAGLKELLESYEPFELKTKFEIMNFCSNQMIFKLKDYPQDPVEGYTRIFQDLKSLIADFDYQNLNIAVRVQEPPWGQYLIEQKINIEFELDSVSYSYSFFYDYLNSNPLEVIQKRDSLLKISPNFHRGINKLLADRNSEYRLYYANKPDQISFYGQEEFGMMLLTEKQFKAWGTSNSDYFLFRQSHDNRFNTSGNRAIIDEYKALGLFDHLEEKEFRQGMDCVNESVIESHQSLLRCFPKTLVHFDWETGNLENPYESITKDFKEASRGQFEPTNIVDTFQKSWEDQTTRFSFELAGKTYEANLKMDGDWLDEGFFALIKQALKENSIDSQIYHCVEDKRYTSSYIMLTTKQYEALMKSQPELFAE
jgi:hypothetical protein